MIDILDLNHGLTPGGAGMLSMHDLRPTGGYAMSVYQWAADELQRAVAAAGEAGFDEALALRALLSQVIERSKQTRSVADLAQELEFLIENLEDRDYAFMRP